MIKNSNLNKRFENLDEELSPFSNSSEKDDEISFRIASPL